MQIAGGHDAAGIFVKQCRPHGAAALDGRIRRYDQLMEVNGIDLSTADHNDAVKAIAVRRLPPPLPSPAAATP
jgi:C-terminal processing protease CtpA/Prc